MCVLWVDPYSEERQSQVEEWDTRQELCETPGISLPATSNTTSLLPGKYFILHTQIFIPSLQSSPIPLTGKGLSQRNRSLAQVLGKRCCRLGYQGLGKAS